MGRHYSCDNANRAERDPVFAKLGKTIVMASLEFEVEKAAFREFYDGNHATLDGALGSFRTLIRSLFSIKARDRGVRC